MHMTKLLWKVDSKFHGIFVIGTNPNGNETWFAYRYSLHSSRYFFTLHNIIYFFLLFYGKKLTRVKDTICLNFIMNIIKSLWAWKNGK
jgi:hypothetical protein